MHVIARAPGKLVVLGEYAVLAGGPALVMAVDRHCIAEIEPSADAACHLATITDRSAELSFAVEGVSGVGIVDTIARHWPPGKPGPWRARLDSAGLYASGRKLGLGSSAAALVAWAGAWTVYACGIDLCKQSGTLVQLVGLHRALQSGTGSGLDIAASLLGGVLVYRLNTVNHAEAVSVALPNGVRFVGVSTGRAASTPDFLARFNAWRTTDPAAAALQLDHMRQVAEDGVACARAGDAEQFLAAVERYGRELEALGAAIGATIVTPEHAAIAEVATRLGVTYKVSGAGGGDVGLGLATDVGALEAFAAAIPEGCEVLHLDIDTVGLITEERVA